MVASLVLHFGVGPLAIHLDPFGCRYPKNIVASDQDLTQRPRVFPVDVFLCVGELNIHVRVDANKSTFVFCLSPFQADDNFFVDQALEQRSWV